MNHLDRNKSKHNRYWNTCTNRIVGCLCTLTATANNDKNITLAKSTISSIWSYNADTCVPSTCTSFYVHFDLCILPSRSILLSSSCAVPYFSNVVSRFLLRIDKFLLLQCLSRFEDVLKSFCICFCIFGRSFSPVFFPLFNFLLFLIAAFVLHICFFSQFAFVQSFDASVLLLLWFANDNFNTFWKKLNAISAQHQHVLP